MKSFKCQFEADWLFIHIWLRRVDAERVKERLEQFLSGSDNADVLLTFSKNLKAHYTGEIFNIEVEDDKE